MRALILILAYLLCPLAHAEKLKVVVSFSILKDWALQVGGEHIEVISLVGRNGDLHSYRATPAAIKTLGDAQLLIINGLGHEGWLARLSSIANYKGTTLIASSGVEQLNQHLANSAHGEHTHTDVDPHAWLSLRNAVQYVRNIGRALGKLDPAHALSYRANADRYIATVESLNMSFKQAFDAIPPARRKIVIAHHAFAYLAADYGMQLLWPSAAISGIGVSARKVASLVEQIRVHGIEVVFLEAIADPRLPRQIAREARVAIGGKLYANALSELDGPAPSYLAMMRHNVATILAALGGATTPGQEVRPN